jgi:amino acid transporter
MQSENTEKCLTSYISIIGAFALALGTILGWGSLVSTSNIYLIQSGPVGSILGVCCGALVMLIIAKNYSFLMARFPDCGGAYSFSKQAYGFDHAYITGWFLASTYLAVLWFNVTSIPLFVRNFIGNIFQFGFKYSICNYEVYFGEALISSLVLILICWVVAKFRKFSMGLMTLMVSAFITLIGICFLLVIKKSGGIQNINPVFVPDTDYMLQVINIAFISPLAFVGFESISHASEEFNFSKDKIINVLFAAIFFAALFYIIILFLSATVYPPQYHSWFEYISNLSKHSGIESFPVFFAVNHYLGDYGYYALIFSLFALILTSLIGNIYALSRLLYRMALDNIIPHKYSELDCDNVPNKAIWLVACLSVLIPFLGRTAIGWIVDVTAIGATLVYAFVSISVWKIAKESGLKKEKVYGLIGLFFMVVFVVYLLCPNLIRTGKISTESYLLFPLWSILGMIYFRQLLKRDNESKNTRFGKSTIVWILLFTIMLSTSFTWMLDSNQNTSNKLISDLESAKIISNDNFNVLEHNVYNHFNQNLFNILVFATVVTVSVILLISNYSFIVKRTHKFEIERKSIEKEFEISQMIQSSVLPVNFPEKDRFELYASMTPSKSVGGDFYDFFKVDNEHEAAIIADVSGKGITAAMFMMNAKVAIKEAVLSGKPLVEAMEKANIDLCEHNKARMFITVFLAVLDLNTGVLKCINAGHNPPLINHKGIWEYCKIKHSIALGVSKKVKFTEVSIELQHQDSLFMYTDGVTEAKDINDNLYGEERLISFLSKQDNQPRSLLNNTLEELKAYAGNAPQSDDITMVMIKYL